MGSEPRDGRRPQVFDADTGEPLGETPEESGAPEHRARMTRSGWAAAVAVALLVGAGAGVGWQDHRDTVRASNTVYVSLSLALAGSASFVSGAAVVPVTVMNSGPTAIRLTSVSVAAEGRTGRTTTGDQIAAGASRPVQVSLGLPCGATGPASVTAAAAVVAPGGAHRTVTAELDTGGAQLVSECTDATPAGPQAVVTSVAATGTTFTAAIRVTLPVGSPRSQVTVSAVPFSPDPPLTMSIDGGATATLQLSLDALNACARSASWDGLPTTFTVTSVGPDYSTSRTSLIMPYSLYRGLIHAVDTGCPPAGS